MQKKGAMPHGYMTVGELAKKMDTTVRTLQYYDKEGLLSPSAESEGGRRLYAHKDMIRLHQILSLKSLGFSLHDIKNNLISLDTPTEVVHALSQQAADIQGKMANLAKSLKAIERLKDEVLQMQAVDFKKYADIIINLQMNNEYYWLIKHLDSDTLDHIRNRFNKESGVLFMNRFNLLNDQVLELQKKGVPPEDEKAQKLAKEFWVLVTEFTEGDMSMLQELMELGKFEDEKSKRAEKQALVNEYLQPALEKYFSTLGVNPTEEVT